MKQGCLCTLRKPAGELCRSGQCAQTASRTPEHFACSGGIWELHHVRKVEKASSFPTFEGLTWVDCVYLSREDQGEGERTTYLHLGGLEPRQGFPLFNWLQIALNKWHCWFPIFSPINGTIQPAALFYYFTGQIENSDHPLGRELGSRIV